MEGIQEKNRRAYWTSEASHLVNVAANRSIEHDLKGAIFLWGCVVRNCVEVGENSERK